MTELHIEKAILTAYTHATKAPILSDELLNYLADVYQTEPAIREQAYFDLFAGNPMPLLGGCRPVEFAIPNERGKYRNLKSAQRLVAAQIDRPLFSRRRTDHE